MLLIFPLTVSQRLLIRKSEIWKPQLNFDIFFHCIVFGQIFVNVDDTAQYVSRKTSKEKDKCHNFAILQSNNK